MVSLGTKRCCQSCGSKYYDFGKDSIVCPSCGAVFDPEVLLKSRRIKPSVLKSPAKSEEPDDLEDVSDIEGDFDADTDVGDDDDDGDAEGVIVARGNARGNAHGNDSGEDDDDRESKLSGDEALVEDFLDGEDRNEA